MGKSSKAEAEKTRQRIIDTAFNMAMDTGFDKASLRGIGAAANITKSGIAAHFKNKADLAKALAPLYAEAIKKPLVFDSPDAFYESWIHAIKTDRTFVKAILTAGPVIPKLNGVKGLFDAIYGDKDDVEKCVYMCIGYAAIHASLDSN